MALTEMRTLMLWALLAKPGGAGLQKDIRPEVKKPDRDALAREGLIRSDPKSRPIMLEVTDKGWAWAGDHLDAELPKRSVHGAAILQAWLKQLRTFMAVNGFVLADVLGTPVTSKPGRPSSPPRCSASGSGAPPVSRPGWPARASAAAGPSAPVRTC